MKEGGGEREFDCVSERAVKVIESFMIKAFFTITHLHYHNDPSPSCQN